MEAFSNIKEEGGHCLTLTLEFVVIKSTFKSFFSQETNCVKLAKILYYNFYSTDLGLLTTIINFCKE